MGGFNPSHGFEGQEDDYAEWDDAAAAPGAVKRNPLLAFDDDEYDMPAWGSKEAQALSKVEPAEASRASSTRSAKHTPSAVKAELPQRSQSAKKIAGRAAAAAATNVSIYYDSDPVPGVTAPPLPARNGSNRPMPGGLTVVQTKTPKLRASKRGSQKKASGTSAKTKAHVKQAEEDEEEEEVFGFGFGDASEDEGGDYDTPAWGSKGNGRSEDEEGDYQTPTWGSKGNGR